MSPSARGLWLIAFLFSRIASGRGYHRTVAGSVRQNAPPSTGCSLQRRRCREQSNKLVDICA
ncbi:hypothetical protein KCP69_10125 [Salmonella enterica subsp. enterica]|nr:hypothetical protein KCP69_10125 [Salmonella enterica subsp. enterica]